MRFRYLLIILLCILSISGLWAQGKDFLFSLAVPGFSQVMNGKSHGYVMMAAEAALIGTSLYLSSEADLLMDESYSYALKFAELNPADYDTEFLKNLGKYNSSGFDADGYNAMIRREAQAIFSDSPDSMQIYIEDHSYGEDQYWRWESAGRRADYNRMRNNSVDLESYGKLVVGVMILNHLVSGMDVLISHSQKRRTQLSMGIHRNAPMLKLTLRF
ncbi:MAG: hypothetical protein LHW64_02445 [Candidatus Cloacimonetes bacterium]|jgi:hypothetical protein|nr:hypothetical protein [Candidatus Cloacimonadota bacterium]MCB5286649.1 hypothetical protein [Candidatus Cloacimonadota bacterium]MCK9183835.1 hypothetical protein [Candidatus Cloacimonadota bacterium]MCK9584031.1 hypothetical protein [Candidatus Cloacimonadota bacterium]MDY0228969.1 hypothetical protein [Candidatus Cloacimonadaceae bacterium]